MFMMGDRLSLFLVPFSVASIVFYSLLVSPICQLNLNLIFHVNVVALKNAARKCALVRATRAA